MQNNKVGKIAVANAGHKRSRFNNAHDVNTTASFGDLQPLMCKRMEANSKATLDIESLVRLAPLVAPTFGRMSYKTWSMFVPFDEVYPNWDAMQARTTISRVGKLGATEFVPQQVPTISVKQLTALCLLGARCSIWRAEDLSGQTPQPVALKDAVNWTRYSDYTSGVGKAIYDTLFEGGSIARPSMTLADFDYAGPAVNLNFFNSPWTGGSQTTNVASLWVPFGCTRYGMVTNKFNGSGQPAEEITLDNADFVLTCSAPSDITSEGISGYSFAICFRLSAYGKRIRKMLIGLGYPLSLEDHTSVSLLPLLAWYRGYFELFGLSLYENFEQSYCSKLIQLITNDNEVLFENFGVNTQWSNTSSVLWGFFRDLGNCFVTEDVDYVSAHLQKPGTSSQDSPTGQQILNSSRDFMNGSNFIDVTPSSSRIINSMSSGDGNYPTSTGLYFNGVSHGALDEKLLKLFFRWTNRQTIMGSDIEKNLRALGLGKYVDEIKVDFIGYTNKALNVTDVQSSVDNFSVAADGSKSGMNLGEFAGKSVNYDKSQTLSWETKKTGLWIVYGAIVPSSGYCQSYDHTIRAITPFDQYIPELDGLGYEATRADELFGYGQVSTREADGGHGWSKTFGFVPRYFGYKVARNVANGDFSLKSARDSYLPYMLDKFLPINERVMAENSNSTTNKHMVIWMRGLTYSNLPSAGNIWRYAYRYGWLGNLNRIFVNDGDNTALLPNFENTQFGLDGNTYYLYQLQFSDNFLIHNIMNLQYYAPMLPDGASFSASDDDAPANAAVDKT